jgi:hypothetical protein
MVGKNLTEIEISGITFMVKEMVKVLGPVFKNISSRGLYFPNPAHIATLCQNDIIIYFGILKNSIHWLGVI